MQPFLALITPLGSPSGPVDPGYSPPWATPGPGRPPGVPTHPIYNPAYPDNSLPMPQPPTGAYPPRPTHPIYNPAYPDNTLPGQPPGIWGGPGSLPPFVMPPIYIPGPGEPPLGIWGPTDPRPTPPIVLPPGTPTPVPPGVPTHPIVLPPDLPPVTPEGGKIDWKTAWTPTTGWVVIGVPAEGTLVPTPSK